MYLNLSLFFIYAFLGWCTEVTYSALNKGKFINRGFLNGPVCPIYGFGVLIVVTWLTPFKGNKLLLFLGSVFFTSALELITGFLLDKIFHKKWWDYSDLPFNIGGYICLKFSVLWGLACLFIMEIIHPIILVVVNVIPLNLGNILLLSFSLILLIDLIATINSINKLNRKLQLVDEIGMRIRDISDDIGEKISTRSLLLVEKNNHLKEEYDKNKTITIEAIEMRVAEFDRLIKERRQELKELKLKYDDNINKRFFGEKRIFQAFPKMNTKKYKDVFEELKEKFSVK